MAKLPLENFEKTLTQLKLFCAKPVEDDRDKAGIIQAFEFTFEQSWLSIQKLIAKYNVKAPTPKQAYSAAMKQGWISTQDEQDWLDLIEDRNLTSHTYKKELADEILSKITSQYIQMFEGLLNRLKQEA